MKVSVIILLTVAVVAILAAAVAVYFYVYKKNINKALNGNEGKPACMIPPYKILLAVVAFIVSVAVAASGVAGLLYSKKYFGYEKDYTDNLDVRTISVSFGFDEEKTYPLKSFDTDRIREAVKAEYPGRRISVIPVYTCMGISSDSFVNFYAVYEKSKEFLGLNEMLDDTAYFTDINSEKVDFDVSVTKIVEGGFVSDKLEHITLNAESGVDEKLLLSLITENMMPSERENITCFVNMNTFCKVASLLVDSEIKNVADLDSFYDLIRISNIYVYVDDLSLLSLVNSTLTSEKYYTNAPINEFEKYEEIISITFTIYILSAVVLVCLTAVNAYFSLKISGRIRDKKR